MNHAKWSAIFAKRATVCVHDKGTFHHAQCIATFNSVVNIVCAVIHLYKFSSIIRLVPLQLSLTIQLRKQGYFVCNSCDAFGIMALYNIYKTAKELLYLRVVNIFSLACA